MDFLVFGFTSFVWAVHPVFKTLVSIAFLGALDELFFLVPIDEGRKYGHDEASHVNCNTVKPCIGVFWWVGSAERNNELDCGDNDQDQEHQVFEHLNGDGTKGLGLNLFNLVISEALNSCCEGIS